MRRIAILAFGAALLAAFPITHEALANNGRKAPMVDLCHNTSIIASHYHQCGLRCPDGTVARGRWLHALHQGSVITVNGNAVAGHLGHGDSTSFGPGPDGSCRFITGTPRDCDASCD